MNYSVLLLNYFRRKCLNNKRMKIIKKNLHGISHHYYEFSARYLDVQ